MIKDIFGGVGSSVPENPLFEKLAELFAPIFCFLAKGRGMGEAELAARVWVVRRVICPHTMGCDTPAAFADRCGASVSRVGRLEKQFRALYGLRDKRNTGLPGANSRAIVKEGGAK